MRGSFVFIFLITILTHWAQAAEPSCQSCHREMHSNCGLTCQACHLSPNATQIPGLKNHPAVIANPSTSEWWAEKCLSCHQKEIRSFEKSLHYSNAGCIDQTRFLLGKNARLFQTNQQTWQRLKSVRKIEKPIIAGLADHLLAGKCLSCHFESDRRQDAFGRKHAAGCAACHVTIDQNTGHPLHGHQFQKKPDDIVCLSCHSGNRVGADYYGYFEHDYHNQYQTPYGSKPEFAAFQHRLQTDVHRRAGMHCTDCHTEHGSHQTAARFEGQYPDVRCSDCHGGFGEKPTRAFDRIKLFSSKIIAHQNFHSKVRCSSCHAQWSYQDYGLHLFLDQSRHYEMWEDYLWQGDGEVTALLQQQLALPENQRVSAYSTNKLSGQKMPGIWYKGLTFRRWENPVLGWDTQGKIGIIRPFFQYFITYVDSLDRVWIDSEKPVRKDGTLGWNWDAYVPHTIGAKGRSCESCHLNPKVAGLGIRQSADDSAANVITLPSAPILPRSRLLNSEEQKRLLQKSRSYKYWRSKAYLQNGIRQLFEDGK